MDAITLSIHNINRWVVLGLFVLVLFRAYRGWLGEQEWEPLDRTSGLIFLYSLDIQLLLGVVLIFLKGVKNLGFFYMDHIIPMFLAVVIAHVGRTRTKKPMLGTQRHRNAALWYSLVLVIVLVSVPWGRPLLPAF